MIAGKASGGTTIPSVILAFTLNSKYIYVLNKANFAGLVKQ